MKLTKKDMAELMAAAREYKPRNRLWTHDEDEVVRLFYGKVPKGMLANKLCRSPESVQQRYKRFRAANSMKDAAGTKEQGR